MYLKSLSLLNFKNYEQVDIPLSEKINCFVGENGVGKTNILDAIHYLSLCKSSMNPVDTQNILHERDFMVIQGIFVRKEKEENIFCSVRHQKKKQFKRNGKEYDRLSEHIGLLPLVMISPNDTELINGGSEERRRFINGVIAQYDNLYLENLIQYNRALSQRNKLLKDFNASGRFPPDLLEVWDEQLIRYGIPVHEARTKFIERMIPVFREYYQMVSGGKEQVSLKYHSQLNSRDFPSGIRKSLEKDRVLQYSTFGIHKDDLDMQLEDYPLKKVGSQGQQKTYLVALKLAEFEFIRQTMTIPPILLLDDIFDKFDEFRVKQIIKLVAENNFGQIFITDTNENRLFDILKEIPADHLVYKIGPEGEIKELKN
ncbi:MAG: DNA replication/repair protein RecF [Bacteroidales bacterium]|nr:DNA replication/repair protein RecF [Bacteroidales bacterium]MBN2697881.1 DNA replication/repair protein RecF [Bacteroidales bacterium]